MQRGDQLLKREDPDASQILARAFEREGVRVMLSATVTHVTRTNESEKTVHIVQGDAETTLVVDAIIVGAGFAGMRNTWRIASIFGRTSCSIVG